MKKLFFTGAQALRGVLTLLALLTLGISAWAQQVTWTVSSSATYTQGDELSSYTDVVSVTLGNGTWAYDSSRKGIYVKTQTITRDESTNVPTAGDYIVVKPVKDVNLSLSTYASQSNCNLVMVEASAPTTTIKDFREKAEQTNDFGTLSAGKTYYIYGTSFKSTGTLDYIFFKSFTIKTVESYSIKYTDNSATPVTIKDDITGTGLYGDKVTASSDQMADITYDGNTYVYDSGNAEITLGTTNTITLVYKQATVYGYTIKYVDEDGNSIADDVTGTGAEGKVITASSDQMADITKDSQKYIYKSGNKELALTTTEADNVITLVYRKAANYSYALRAMNGETVLKTLAEGIFVEGESASVTFPKAVTVDGVVYTTAETTFKKTISTEGNTDIAYTESDYAYFFEETDLTRSNNSGKYAATHEKTFMSGASGARLFKSQTAYSSALSAGTYTVTISAAIYSGSPTLTYGYILDGTTTTVGTTAAWANGSYFATKDVTFYIPEGASLAFINSNTEYNSNVILDYALLKKVSDYPVIGAIDKSTADMAAKADDVTIKQGETKIFKFINHGTTYGNNWKIIVKEGDTNKSITRADSYDEVPGAATATSYKVSKDGGATKEALNWDEYAADMANAECIAILAYGTDGTLSIKTTSTGAANGYIYYVDQNVTGLTSDLTVNLSVCQSWMEVIANGNASSANLGISNLGWGTFIAPFEAAIPDGVTAYTVTVDGSNLNKTAVTTGKFAANVPYLVQSDAVVNTNMYGVAVAATNSYKEGALVGNVGAAADVTANAGETGTFNYLLQYKGSNLGFYKVTTSGLKVGKNRCYLTTTVSGAKAAYFLDGDMPTAVSNVEAADAASNGVKKYMKAGQLVIKTAKGMFNAAGQQVK